jgi:hypothetical protein
MCHPAKQPPSQILEMLHVRLAQRNKIVGFAVGKNAMRDWYAQFGFQALGTNAVSALPRLVELMGDTNAPEVADGAINALSFVGKPAFPYLTQALSNTNHPHRAGILVAISYSMQQTVGTNAAMQPIVAALNDSDPTVRYWATNCLQLYFPEAPTNSAPAQP